MPKQYEVFVTPDAEANLQEIYDYIAYTLLVPETADAYVDAIAESILKLDMMPNGRPLVDFEPWRSRGMRHFTVKNFVVYYIVREETARVYVMNVIYGKRDQEKVLE